MNPQNSTATSTAILVVSFGTAVSETRRKTLEAIETVIQNKYPQFTLYRAWTSTILREKVLLRDGMKINSLKEAFDQLKQDGVRKIIIQPTFVSVGNEYTRLKQEIINLQTLPDFENTFSSVSLGTPLLSQDCSMNDLVSAVMSDFVNLSNEELLLFIGHETADCTNPLYARLNSAFHQSGYSNVLVTSMCPDSGITDILLAAKEQCVSKIILAPFMISSGYHARKDIAGDHDGSWKSQLEQAGFSVRCIMKGLGQYPGIQNIFVDKLAALLE